MNAFVPYVVTFILIAFWSYWVNEFLKFRETNRKVQQLLDQVEEKDTKRKKLDMWV